MSRSPGFYEKHFLLRNANGLYTNLSSTAKYNKHVTKAHLAEALRLLINENLWFTHNTFRVANTGNVYKDYVTRPVDHINFDSVVQYIEIEEFDRYALERTVTMRVPVNRDDAPLWRLLVMETKTEQYFTFYACHSHFDGGSTAQFHKDLMGYLGKTSGSEFNGELYKNQGTSVLPAVETLTNLFYPLWFQKFKFFFEIKTPKLYEWVNWIFNGFKSPKLFEAEPISANVENKIRIINLPPSEVSKLVGHCRSNSYTVTPYITAVVKRSLERFVFPQYHSNPEEVSTKLFMAVEGRRYYPELSEDIKYGAFVCGDTYIMPHQDNFEGEVKEIHKKIKESIESKEGFKHVWALKIMDTVNMLKSLIGLKKRTTLLITNLGSLKEVPDQEWQITDAYFTLNNSLVYHFIVHAVSTAKGGLNICLSYLPEYENLTTTVDEKEVSVMNAVEADIRASFSRAINQ